MAHNAEARKQRIIDRDLTGLKFGSWTVIGPAIPNKTVIWICECKCGYRQPLTRKMIRQRRYYRTSLGCEKCRFSVQLGKGNVPHTKATVSEVLRRTAWLGDGGRKRWAKYSGEGDRMEVNRMMNEARLKLFAERAARGESKGHPRMWSEAFRNQVAVIKQKMQEAQQ